MNYDFGTTPIPIRVLIVNPLNRSSELVMMKILGGDIFGDSRPIDMTLLVYSNEVEACEKLRISLISCAYICTNTIKISTELPSLTDADVFCFITDFPNPHRIDFSQLTADHFDTFYLLLKIARNFSLKPLPKQDPQDIFTPKQLRPIFVADGLVTINVLYNMSKNIPADCLFCSTSLSYIAKAVLADYLKVTCDVINDVLVWAADNKTFHAAVVDPCITKDQVDIEARRCVWKAMGNKMMEQLNLDHSSFNATWLKREFIEKIKSVTSQNPFGPIFRGQMVYKTLKEVWMHRNSESSTKYCNLGVISNGSIGLIKGCSYVLPLIFEGDTYSFDPRFTELSIVRMELKKMNEVSRESHEKLMHYCKKFLAKNVMKQEFIPKDDSSVSFDFTRPTDSSCRGNSTRRSTTPASDVS